jgi:hypothetical protein
MTEYTHPAEELLPIIDKVWAILAKECKDEPVQMQKVMELMIAKFGFHMGSYEDSCTVAEHMYRHAMQLIDQLYNKEIMRNYKLWDLEK